MRKIFVLSYFIIIIGLYAGDIYIGVSTISIERVGFFVMMFYVCVYFVIFFKYGIESRNNIMIEHILQQYMLETGRNRPLGGLNNPLCSHWIDNYTTDDSYILEFKKLKKKAYKLFTLIMKTLLFFILATLIHLILSAMI